MNKSHNTNKSRVTEAASDLFDEGKKWAHEMQDEGFDRVNQAEEKFKECSDQLLKKVQDNPLTSILIAGGVGFLLSRLLKK